MNRSATARRRFLRFYPERLLYPFLVKTHDNIIADMNHRDREPSLGDFTHLFEGRLISGDVMIRIHYPFL